MPSKLLLSAAVCLACLRPAMAADISLQQGGAALLPAAIVAPATVVALPRRGALYKVSLDGKVSYLFGTIHAGREDFFPLEPQVTRALHESSALVIELDIRENDAFQVALSKHGSYAKGDTLDRHLSPSTLKLLLPALTRAGLSMKAVEHYKPWLVANLLVGKELERAGFQRGQAVEYVLLDAARKQAKAVRELESADYQLALFDTLDGARQEQYLLENLADLADGAALKKSQQLIDAWDSADSSRLTAAWRSATTGNSVSAIFMQDTLLGKRNPEMASSIQRIMAQDKVAFVGVGVLHLVGDNGLPQLLRQRGYQVEQLY
jgi:uncharacterized protein YbaP (TraB family)